MYNIRCKPRVSIGLEYLLITVTLVRQSNFGADAIFSVAGFEPENVLTCVPALHGMVYQK